MPCVNYPNHKSKFQVDACNLSASISHFWLTHLFMVNISAPSTYTCSFSWAKLLQEKNAKARIVIMYLLIFKPDDLALWEVGQG